ncbi:hypothetical protein [Lewinella sp. JB7]|uniref:hypothetical protein n=1 Tax=Lewinella sp. JB7 TaxID=2962887 RepID=UPI0020C97820|nr:hypothetical protein [Lewinella sp. JB7]MCP9237949.1 hypothetical protein [Lewinella sp. JB7]
MYSDQPDLRLNNPEIFPGQPLLIYYGNHQILKVSELEDGIYAGSVLSYIYHEDRKDQFNIDEVYNIYRYERMDKLPSQQTNTISQIIKETEFDKFKDPSEIKDYEFGWLDCTGSAFEVLVDDSLSSYNYPCLKNQKNNIELSKIKCFDSIVRATVPFSAMYDSLLAELPKGKSYRRDHINIYLMTDEQIDYRKSNIARFAYEDSTQDSITAIFSDKFNSVYLSLDKATRQLYADICYEEFEVNYDRNGKLLSVVGADVSRSDKDAYFRQCKRELRTLLRSVDLEHKFIYPQTKWIIIYEDEIEVDDRRRFR